MQNDGLHPHHSRTSSIVSVIMSNVRDSSTMAIRDISFLAESRIAFSVASSPALIDSSTSVEERPCSRQKIFIATSSRGSSIEKMTTWASGSLTRLVTILFNSMWDLPVCDRPTTISTSPLPMPRVARSISGNPRYHRSAGLRMNPMSSSTTVVVRDHRFGCGE